jgi:hypothetical protein
MNPSSSDANPPTGARTLQELSAEKTLEQLRKDKQAVTTFDSLDPGVQQVLFARLWQDYIRLYEVEHKYKTYQKWCPLADADLYTARARTRLINFNPESEDYVEEEPTAERVCDEFRAKWRYRDPAGFIPPTPNDDNVSWGMSHVFMPSSSERHFELCQCGRNRGCSCGNQKGGGLLVPEAISSQLLLYRLHAVFGMPPPHPDVGYKTCWTVELGYRQEVSTVFLLEDYKGGVNLRFYGSKDASSSAMDLLNWLISDRVPHEYDGLIAGTVA